MKLFYGGSIMNLIYIYIYIDKIQFEVFSIYSGRKNSILQNELIIPKSFNIGDKLEYIRNFISVVINQKNLKKAYLNIKDNLEIDTIKIEGILEEVLASYGVEICN